MPHTGGKRFEPDSEYCQTLMRWLEAGAAERSGRSARGDRGRGLPAPGRARRGGATQQFIARAEYSDGTDRDVTNLAVFLTNNDNSAPINADGLVTAANRGEAFVMARFATHTVGSQVLVLPKDLQYTPPATQPANYIDELVNAKLQKLRMLPSDAMQRRGLPAPRDDRHHGHGADRATNTWSSLADTDPQKRAKLVDRLLERKEFSEIWAMKWAELLMVKSTIDVSYKSMFLYSNWLTERISSNMPLEPDGARAARRQRRHIHQRRRRTTIRSNATR